MLALAAALCAPASRAAEQWEIKRANYYLTAKQQQMPEFKPPPAAGSRADLADLAVLREWQKKRTTEQCAAANSEARADYDLFFGEISPFIRPLPVEAAAVLKRVKTETDGIAADIKEKFKRPRPFERAADLEPCLGRIGGLAYPSGHATISRLYALMLSDLAPERRAEFLARADEIGLYRIIGGVHHPTDIEAGQALADILYRRYLKSQKFRKDMQALRGYLLREPAGAVK